MEFPIQFEDGPLYMYIEGSQVIISKILSLKIDFVLANPADPDEMRVM